MFPTASSGIKWAGVNQELPGFLLRILWCSQSGDHPESNLANFSYILDTKVGKKKKKFIFWLPTGTYHKNLVIWIFFL
jgi:hypothetical protein